MSYPGNTPYQYSSVYQAQHQGQQSPAPNTNPSSPQQGFYYQGQPSPAQPAYPSASQPASPTPGPQYSQSTYPSSQPPTNPVYSNPQPTGYPPYYTKTDPQPYPATSQGNPTMPPPQQGYSQAQPQWNPQAQPQWNHQDQPKSNPQAQPQWNPQAQPQWNPQSTSPNPLQYPVPAPAGPSVTVVNQYTYNNYETHIEENNYNMSPHQPERNDETSEPAIASDDNVHASTSEVAVDSNQASWGGSLTVPTLLGPFNVQLGSSSSSSSQVQDHRASTRRNQIN